MNGTIERLRMYDDLLAPVVAVGPDGTVVYFNSTFAAFLKLPPRKIRQRPLGEVLRTPEGDSAAFESYLEDCRASGGPVVTPEVAIAAGVDKREVVLKFFPVPEVEGVFAVTVQDFSIERILHEKHRRQLDELREKNAEIQRYSEHLEELVEERTRELREAKEETESILRSIREGIFVIEPDLTIGSQCSGAASELLGNGTEGSLTGRHALETLFPDPSALGEEALPSRDKFHGFLKAVFRLLVPEQFEDLARFLPQSIKYPGKGGLKTYSLSFSPVIADDEILRVVVAVRDDTELEELRNLAALVHKRVLSALEAISRLKDDPATRSAYKVFLESSASMMQDVEAALSTLDSADVNALFRRLHTIKGGSRHFKLDFLQYFAHESEEILAKLRDGQALNKAERTRLTDLTASLRSGLATLASFALPISPSEDGDNAWQRFRASLSQAVKALGNDLGKKVELDVKATHALSGRDLVVLQEIGTHLFRNALDHGIEAPAERLEVGKPETARLLLTIEVRGREALCRFEDDGRGIDFERVKAHAQEKGLWTSGPLTRETVLRLLTAPGFSTRTEVSEISGRGVGLDAVRATLEEHGGKLTLEETSKQGTRFLARWPLKARATPLASPEAA